MPEFVKDDTWCRNVSQHIVNSLLQETWTICLTSVIGICVDYKIVSQSYINFYIRLIIDKYLYLSNQNHLLLTKQ